MILDPLGKLPSIKINYVTQGVTIKGYYSLNRSLIYLPYLKIKILLNINLKIPFLEIGAVIRYCGKKTNRLPIFNNGSSIFQSDNSIIQYYISLAFINNGI